MLGIKILCLKLAAFNIDYKINHDCKIQIIAHFPLKVNYNTR